MPKRKKPDMKTVTVNSWAELHDEIEASRKYLKQASGEDLWFRGVSDHSHRLLPSLLRSFGKNVHKMTDAVKELESDLFFEFMAKARSSDGATLDEWDILFLMQHYRAPTRLLDWTETLFVALHFAVAYLAPGDAKIPRLYIMNPYQWNEAHTGERDLYWPRYLGYDPKIDYYWQFGELITEDEIDWKFPIALYPPQRNPRLSAQRGFFTIHGTDLRSLEDLDPTQLVAIDLGEQAVSEVKILLRHAGVDELLLFPDLDGLSRQLRINHGI